MFLKFLAASHILTVNCAEITRNRPGQPAIKFFLALYRLFSCTLYSDCPSGRADAVARHVSFAEITCVFNVRL